MENGLLNNLNVFSKDPLCAGLRLPDLDISIFDTRNHFIRSHFTAPQLDVSSWFLQVTGDVENPLTIRYDDLLNMPSHQIVSVMECAGNSRSTMQPPAEGVQWDNGGVSIARWKGVALKTVLEKAGVSKGATDVLFEGADFGTELHAGGPMCYAMSVPRDKLLEPTTILAYEMNGNTLPEDHGFPLRLLVPGWYGMVSVKWLTKITVMDHPNRGFHEMDYRIYPATDDQSEAKVARVTSLKVKSLIGTPCRGDIVAPGPHKITGVAWSGDGHIREVDVSTDGNRTWRPATLEEPSGAFSWQRWEIDWEPTYTGHALLGSRATDSRGNVQPVSAEWNFRGYQVNSIHFVPVTVRKPS